MELDFSREEITLRMLGIGERRPVMAVTLTLEELAQAITAAGEAIPEDYLTILTRQLATATSAVQQYAPAAPDDVANEAVVLIVGYALESPLTTRAPRAPSNAFINSGARALLAPFHIPVSARVS